MEVWEILWKTTVRDIADLDGMDNKDILLEIMNILDIHGDVVKDGERF